jgi:ribosomal protein S18 acetylase RimI-like enzyme
MNAIIEVGYLKKRDHSHDSTVKYVIKFLKEDNLKDIINLQEIILRNLSDPTLYEPASIELFKERLVNEKSVIGVEAEDGLIAFGIIQIPGDIEDNLGNDIGINKTDLYKVAHIQFIVVHPYYRGNLLQKKLACFLLNIIKDKGYQHVLGTISPGNYYSLSNMLHLGFVIREIKEKYGGKLRYIIYNDIKSIRNQTWQNVVRIQISDIDGQKKLIKEGFVGFDVSYDAKETSIIYGKATEI